MKERKKLSCALWKMQHRFYANETVNRCVCCNAVLFNSHYNWKPTKGKPESILFGRWKKAIVWLFFWK